MAFLGACGDDQDTQATQEPQPTAAEESAAPSGPPIQVVATTNFVADWARVVGGDRVEVFGMLPAGGDPHSYQPGARDVARVADADVVFTVGLELETLWLEDLIRSASADESRIVALGEVVDPMEFAEADMHDDHDDHGDHSDHEEDHSDHEEDHSDHEEDHSDHEEDHSDHEEDHSDHEEDHSDHEEDAHGHDDHHDHHHGTFDPHFWFDPIRVKIAVNEIAARLSAIDPENADFYSQNASEYGKQLDELHAWTMEQISAVAPERRLLVTSHDAFSYFAEAYGFEIVGLVIPSLAPDVEPSAEHIAGLVEVIEEHGVPALFGETTVSDKLAQAVARETGASLVQLYSGSLGAEGSGADTYLTMVRANVERIVGALK
ncbi:MAG: zinc ABC transporter substrate-binding protein [bacterium]|nr:zinc ABC transporter substrate-binding protein [bacterium]